jgi:hypothetical protein
VCTRREEEEEDARGSVVEWLDVGWYREVILAGEGQT